MMNLMQRFSVTAILVCGLSVCFAVSVDAADCVVLKTAMLEDADENPEAAGEAATV